MPTLTFSDRYADPACMREPSFRFLVSLSRWLLLALLAGVFVAAPMGAAECSDGIDNDGDYATDYPNDPDCADSSQDDEVGPEPVYTADFTAEPTGQVPELFLPSVNVSSFFGDVTVTNAPDEFGGVGVANGLLPDFIDPGHEVLFRFVKNGLPSSARDVAYRVHAAPGDPGPLPGEVEVVLYDHQGVVLNNTVHQGLGTRELNFLFATPHVFAFSLRPLAHPMRVSGLVYTLNPECDDGLDNDGDYGTDASSDVDCTDPSLDSEVGPEPSYTADFTAEPSGQVPELFLPSVNVSSFFGDVTVTNAPDEFGGVGVANGLLPDFIDPGHEVLFRFVKNGLPSSARDVAYRVHAAPGDVGLLPGEVEVVLYDHQGVVLNNTVHQGLGTRELNFLFGTPHVFAFSLRPLAHPMRVSGLIFQLNQPCSDGLDNDNDGLIDFDGAGGAPDPQCGGTPGGGESLPACGLGFEAVPFLVLWRRLRRRKAAARAILESAA